MPEHDDPRRNSTHSSTREFLLILICAMGLSFAFMHWLRTSSQAALGGLDVGETAPSIAASHWVNGEPPAADELSGKVHVVVAWATWCAPCYREAPHLIEVYEQVHSLGVEFVGLTSEDESRRERIEKWIEETGIPWPNGYGADADATLQAYRVHAIPMVWVVGKDGRIAWNRSYESSESLQKAIEQALRE